MRIIASIEDPARRSDRPLDPVAEPAPVTGLPDGDRWKGLVVEQPEIAGGKLLLTVGVDVIFPHDLARLRLDLEGIPGGLLCCARIGLKTGAVICHDINSVLQHLGDGVLGR